MVMGRKPVVSITSGQRQEAATRAKAYRRHWFMSQEQLAVELGTHPSVVAVIERAGPFGSTRFVAACLALDPATAPKDEAARHHRAMRDRTRTGVGAPSEHEGSIAEAPRVPRPADDKEYPFD